MSTSVHRVCVGNVGLGEREARVASGLVAKRHYRYVQVSHYSSMTVNCRYWERM